MKHLQTFLAAFLLAVILPVGPRDIVAPTDPTHGCTTIKTEVIGKDLVETLKCCWPNSSGVTTCSTRFRVTPLNQTPA